MYKERTRKEFEFHLTQIKVAIDELRSWAEISSIISDAIPIFEYVYQFSTKNKALNILVFSSVDKRTDSTRDLGTDAVRVIFKWDTKNGALYKKHKKLYRVENLFENLSEALIEAVKDIFCLNGKTFTSDIGVALN